MKTGTGRRTIDLDPGTVDVLKAWRIERAEEKGGIEPAGDELVFVKPDGSWIHPHSFSQVLDRKVAKLDVPPISLHDLRHTHATLLLKAGVPVKVVSERLGHANVAFTMSVYQHVLPGMQAAAASTFAELLRSAEATQRRGTPTESETGPQTGPWAGPAVRCRTGRWRHRAALGGRTAIVDASNETRVAPRPLAGRSIRRERSTRPAPQVSRRETCKGVIAAICGSGQMSVGGGGGFRGWPGRHWRPSEC